MSIEVTKRLIGLQDMSFATGGTSANETFEYTPTDGPVIQLTKIDARHLKFSSVAKSVEDLIDGGKDVSIQVNALTVGGAATLEGALSVTGATAFSAIPTGPASDPTTDNQLARKKYVNDQDTLLKTGIQNCSYVSGTEYGAVDSYQVDLSPAIGSYTDGLLIMFRPLASNTSSTPTLSINGLASKTIVKGSSDPLAAGDMIAGATALIRYVATGTKFELLNPYSENPNVKLAGDVVQCVTHTGTEMYDHFSTNTLRAIDLNNYTIGQGSEWATLAITPTHVNNILIADVGILCNTQGVYGSAALFRGDTSANLATCVQVSYTGYPGGMMQMVAPFTAGTVAALTLSVRIGSSNASYYVEVNGWAALGGDYGLYGNSLKSWFRIWEIKV